MPLEHNSSVYQQYKTDNHIFVKIQKVKSLTSYVCAFNLTGK